MTTPLMRSEPDVLPQPADIARHLTGAGLALAIFIWLIGNFVDLAQGRIAWHQTSATWSGFWAGKVTAGIAAGLSKATIPSKSARLQRGLNWTVLKDLGPRVRTGCQGWWFLNDELLLHRNGTESALRRASVVGKVRQSLEKRDIKLLVVGVPDKSRIEQSHLCGLRRAPALDERLHDWETALRKNGVNFLNLQAALAAVPQQADGSAAMLRSDTHWNDTGAAAAADAVAKWIESMGVPVVPQLTYQIHYLPEVQRWGDLTRLAGLDGWPWMRGFTADRVQQPQFTMVEAAGAADDAEDLFGDAELPSVALIGTSYSNTSYFVEHLQYRLRTRIGNFARDGGDFAGAAREYFASRAFKETPPQLVIWEIPERVLQLPAADADEFSL
jgi:alginate O-acetyltransferase complex protein AlgJ